VQTIALDTLRFLNSAQKSGVIPFPAIFTLQNTRVHISTSDSCDILSNVEATIDKALGSTSTLNVPNINPKNQHI